MNPIVMAVLLLGLLAVFVWSASRRWLLLRAGSPTHESRSRDLSPRLRAVWTFALCQHKLRYYLTAGLAHQFIFLGFLVLLARSVTLWGRGFVADFDLWILGPQPVAGVPLGELYAFAKDVFALLVLIGVSVFFWFRVVVPQRRMTLGWEGLLILAIIFVMMVADFVYDGAAIVLSGRVQSECAGLASSVAQSWCGSAATVAAPLAQSSAGPTATGSLSWHLYPEPVGSAFAALVQDAAPSTLVVLAHVGFWTHASLVLVFLNLLPHTKHFHIITAIPNVFLGDLTPAGRLRPLASGTDQLMAMVDHAMQKDDMLAAPIGYARIEHFTWKDILDFYSCTECGRCTDNCPANLTGKVLSPKQLTLDLRDHLYARQGEFVRARGFPRVTLAELKDSSAPAGRATSDLGADSVAQQNADRGYRAVDLVPKVIHPDVLWACLTCRACEEQCPVNITYVDKIVQMRRNLVVIRGESFPHELGKPFEGMEVNGNPWNLSRLDRTAWAEGLQVTTFADRPEAEVLFWVGCAPSFDDRARKVARAMVRLLQQAGVDFAILGEEESCTGDAARRAGNEFLFATLAEQNVATINQYVERGGVRQIVTVCPHCYNTLAHEYADFGGHYDVAHHAEFLRQLVQQGKLKPTRPVAGIVTYHDSCYLGRYNGIYDAPRELLKSIPGLELREVNHYRRHRAFCCGAGGAQMWIEEQNKERVNVRRTRQLLETGAATVASACPFCMTMLSDGLKSEDRDDQIKNLDVAELLALACDLREPLTPGQDQRDPER
jgi:Fe-S oxidoreductase